MSEIDPSICAVMCWSVSCWLVRLEYLGFDWSRLALVGTLDLPDSRGPHPVVLMMQGSGPADRLGNGYFPPIRDAFLAQGIATYAFDKPGCGESTGDWREYALEGRADQASAALAVLREHSAVDGERIGVWGQSQGGWLVQMLASRVPDLAFAIANSGPSIGVAEQDLYGCEHTMLSEGKDESEIEQALAFIRQLHQAARRGASYQEVEVQLLNHARKESWYGYATVEDAEDWALTRRFVEEGYEPLEALVQIQCPFLAVYGGRDILLPAWQNAEETGRALRRAANPDATVVVFPEGDHRIQNESAQSLVTGYLELLSDWAARRATPSRNTNSS